MHLNSMVNIQFVSQVATLQLLLASIILIIIKLKLIKKQNKNEHSIFLPHHNGMGKIRCKTRCFHAKFQDKSKKWKKKEKTMFSSKMVNFTGIWNFLLSLYPLMSLTLFFPLFSTTAWFPSAGFRQAGLHWTHGGRVNVQWRGAWSLAAYMFGPLWPSSILDRLHPIGFSRGGV